MENQNQKSKKILIVGGVAGGATAAARLRRLDETAEIVMFERGEFISYANCGLPYYVGDVIKNKKKLTLKTPESFYNVFNVDVRTHHEVLSINRDEKSVFVKNKKNEKTYTETYDTLILATGAEPIKATDVKSNHIFTLRSVSDAFEIKDFVQSNGVKNVFVLGGGYIGLEMAENLKQIGLDVTLVQRSKHLMKTLDYDMACFVHDHARSKGIHLILEKTIDEIKDKGTHLDLKIGDKYVSADMLLISAGVTPESFLAIGAGLKKGPKNTIWVDENMKTSDPNIYAVGDAVCVRNTISGNMENIALAGPANQQARIAADNINGIHSIYSGTQGSSILKFFDMTIASTGLKEEDAVANGFEIIKVYTVQPSHASYYPKACNLYIKAIFDKKEQNIIGAQIIGCGEGVDKRIDVLATAVYARMKPKQLKELQLCYAPPFTSPKDPVNIVGLIAENIFTDKISEYDWKEAEFLTRDTKTFFLDVRTQEEYDEEHIPGAFNIPLEALRSKMDTITDRMNKLHAKEICVYCQTGKRSYNACRMLEQKGIKCHNLAGGFSFYKKINLNKII